MMILRRPIALKSSTRIILKLDIKLSQLNLQSKRSYNKRIFKNVQAKFQRNLENVIKKSKEHENVEAEPKLKIKKNISNAIEIIEDQNVIRKRQQILNKAYLESISEIISIHTNFDQLPHLNINNVETNRNLLHVKIYWNFTSEDEAKVQEYDRLLKEMIPEIKKSLTANYYRNTAPEISFIYDVYDGMNKQMEFLFGSVKHETAKLVKEPFDPAKLFEKEKLIKKEFDIKSIVLRDPSVDFQRDEQHPTKFKHPFEMNLFMYNLDFKKIYESILIKISQGKSKRSLTKVLNDQQTKPSIYVQAPFFKQSELDQTEFDLPLTDDRVKLMKQFVIANKKKIQRESREMKKDMFNRLDSELDEKLTIKKELDDFYNHQDD